MDDQLFLLEILVDTITLKLPEVPDKNLIKVVATLSGFTSFEICHDSIGCREYGKWSRRLDS